MKETIAGTIFLLLWIAGLILWGNTKDIQPNTRTEKAEPCKTQGHPLWNDC